MRDAEPRTTLPYKAVESLLRALFGIDEDRRVAFLSRFRYFQAMGFPAARVGRGRKVDYGIDEVLQLALAFQLLQVGVLPVRAVRLVRTGWRSTRKVLASAARRRVADADRRMLVLFPRALEESAPAPGDELMPASDPIGILGLGELVEWLAGKGAVGDGNGGGAAGLEDPACCVVVDPARLMARVRAALGSVDGWDRDRVERECERFAATETETG